MEVDSACDAEFEREDRNKDESGSKDLASNGRSVNCKGVNVEPTVGMAFTDMEEIFQFYKSYGREKGFAIAKRGVKNDEVTGEGRWQTFMCSKGRKHTPRGKNILAPRGSRRGGCHARVCCCKTSGMWVITKVELAHNHEVSPEQSRFLRQHRVIDEHWKVQLEENDKAGIRPCDNVRTVVVQAGGHEELPCLGVDLRNYVKEIRRHRINGGDAEAVHQLFGRMQSISRDFFYSIKPDKEGRLKHVFWADERCRAAYEEFSDVITFDTTYLVNKYEMPFGSFVGVNHHGQSILLGCALLNNEKAETFQWLFQTWLSCMAGKKLNAIITDQCPNIGNAIQLVFPDSRHRWCIWHIYCKLPMKLGRHSEYGAVKDDFMDAVFDSVTVQEFEGRWALMINKFELKGNEWLRTLYDNRERWAPVFVKSIFWAGMSSTQRSESMHSFFDGYVNSRTTLRDFVEQYENAVRQKIEKEVQEDFSSANVEIPCVTRWAIEKLFRRVYTNRMFMLVQKQLTDIMYCDIGARNEKDDKVDFDVFEMVSDLGVRSRRVQYVISYRAGSNEIKCNCRLFEFKGILCSHVLKVITSGHGELVPERYIIRRWRKDVGRRHSKIKLGSMVPAIEVERMKELEKVFYSSIDFAVVDGRKYEFMKKGLIEQNKQIKKWAERCEATIEGANGDASMESKVGKDDGEVGQSLRYKDPVTVKRRGRPRGKRLLPSIEKAAGLKRVPRRQSRVRAPDPQHQVVNSATYLLQQAEQGQLLDTSRPVDPVRIACYAYQHAQQIFHQQRAPMYMSMQVPAYKVWSSKTSGQPDLDSFHQPSGEKLTADMNMLQ